MYLLSRGVATACVETDLIQFTDIIAAALKNTSLGMFFRNGHRNPRSLFDYFRSLKLNNFITVKCEKDPSSIRCWAWN